MSYPRQAFVYSEEKKECWLKSGCPKAEYDAGINTAASKVDHPTDAWMSKLQYGAKLTDSNFRRTMVNRCNDIYGGYVEIEAVLINPVGGFPSEFTSSFDGSMGAKAYFTKTRAQKSFENNNLVLTKTVGTAGKSSENFNYFKNLKNFKISKFQNFKISKFQVVQPSRSTASTYALTRPRTTLSSAATHWPIRPLATTTRLLAKIRKPLPRVPVLLATSWKSGQVVH